MRWGVSQTGFLIDQLTSASIIPFFFSLFLWVRNKVMDDYKFIKHNLWFEYCNFTADINCVKISNTQQLNKVSPTCMHAYAKNTFPPLLTRQSSFRFLLHFWKCPSLKFQHLASHSLYYLSTLTPSISKTTTFTQQVHWSFSSPFKFST